MYYNDINIKAHNFCLLFIVFFLTSHYGYNLTSAFLQISLNLCTKALKIDSHQTSQFHVCFQKVVATVGLNKLHKKLKTSLDNLKRLNSHSSLLASISALSLSLLRAYPTMPLNNVSCHSFSSTL